MKSPSDIPSTVSPEQYSQENHFTEIETRYWRQRLLLRCYHFPVSSQSEWDLAAQIDDVSTGCFFCLRTDKAESAAAKACRIMTLLK